VAVAASEVEEAAAVVAAVSSRTINKFFISK
jgi:hypothetical protein